MAVEKYDIVVIGGGHNGLVAAAYLLKAGLDVCVIERQDIVGGGVVTRELTLPGFKHDLAATVHSTIQANPLLHQDELGLKSKYGLKYIYPDPVRAFLFPDEKALVIYRDIEQTCESIKQFSEHDARAYSKFIEECTKMLIVSWSAFSPIPPFKDFMASLDESNEGKEYLKVMLSSAMDVANDWFEDERVKIALTRITNAMQGGPLEKGTGVGMMQYAMIHKWGYAIPEGGSGVLSDTLAACIKDNKGTIKVSSPVKSIKVERGRAKGVVLESGDEIIAKKAIISAINVKQLFLQMLKTEDLPVEFQTRVKNIKHSTFSHFMQCIALNEAPKYKAGVDVNKTWFIETIPEASPFMEEYLREFEDYTYGIPNERMPIIATATIPDPSRAPKGKHILYLDHCAPYHLKGGAQRWDTVKHKVADDILETARQYTTNLGPDNILGRYIISPLDFERYNASFVEGDVLHISQYMAQMYANRPLYGWGNYKTPVKKLYMCGASTHPGGGCTGGARAAVQVIMEDLGINFKKLMANWR